MAFFHVLEEKTSKRGAPVSSQTLAQLGCDACTLNKAKLKHPKMGAMGAEQPVLYFIGEFPREGDDRYGEHFAEEAPEGALIRNRIPGSWKRKIRWNNVINCNTPEERDPSELEIACCKKRVAADIIKTKPQAVVGFGNLTLQWFIGQLGIKDVWRGRKVACYLEWQGERHGFWYYPMLDPHFVRKLGGESWRGKDWGDEFAADLARLFRDADAGFDEPKVITPDEWKKDIKLWSPRGIGHSVQDWADLISTFTEGRINGFDIETASEDARPYSKDARILSMSFSNGEKTIAYPIHHPEAQFGQFDRSKLYKATKKALLGAKRVIAQNSIFEQEWLIVTEEIGPQVVYKTRWGDSMAVAHTLDERSGGKSLGDITLQTTGTDIKKLSNLDVRNLTSEPLNEVLIYNGLDSKGCKIGWHRLTAQLKSGGWLGGKDLTEIAEAHQRRCGTMARMMVRGVYPNMEEANRLDREFSTEIKKLKKEIDALPEVQKYARQGNRFNPLAYEDTLAVLKIAGFHPEDTTEETLSKIKHPLAKLTLKLRGINKLHTTYVEKIADGTWVHPDGKMHCRCSHLKASTGRTAIEDPPLQQWPKREEESKIVRLVIMAPPKHWILSPDYGQIEFRVVAMASRDRKIVDICWTDYDIHGYWLQRIMENYYPQWVQAKGADTDPKRKKRARDVVKNKWVFPGFFGALPATRAGYLGIPEDVVEVMDRDFWKEYPEVKAWQETLISYYRKHRYAQTLTGRRRHWGGESHKGKPMSPNQVINMPVQGTAADLVQDAQERLDAAVFNDEAPPWCAPHVNIHDDLKFYIPNRDRDMVDACQFIAKTMCLSPYKFINVPLLVEMSLGKTWYDLTEIAKFNSTQFGVTRQ